MKITSINKQFNIKVLCKLKYSKIIDARFFIREHVHEGLFKNDWGNHPIYIESTVWSGVY